MPLTLEEYHRGQVYSVAETAKRETGGGDGIEMITSEPFQNAELPNGTILQSGQYTLKKYHINNKVPSFVRLLCPKGALDLKEECWNAFPYTKTTISNEYLGERLNLHVESTHLADKGETENALNLTPDQLKIREVIFIDIGQPLGSEEEAAIIDGEIPRLFQSTKTLRGPLGPNWIRDTEPIMCCYKLVICEFKVFGLQTRLENFIQKNEQRVFSAFHRRMFCWIDQWWEMTMADARLHEERVAEELNEIRKSGSARGLKAVE